MYVKLVEALCAEHQINLIKVMLLRISVMSSWVRIYWIMECKDFRHGACHQVWDSGLDLTFGGSRLITLEHFYYFI